MKFKKFHKTLREVTTASDIAAVDQKLDTQRRKGKKCKKHRELKCEICEDERYE